MSSAVDKCANFGVKRVLNRVCVITVVNSKEKDLMRHFHKGMIFTVGFIVNNMKPCIRQVMTEEKLEEISDKM
jgi:hypothetical protein